MKVEINSRGNGACPLCRNNGKCPIQKALKESFNNFVEDQDPLQVVIYSCPRFKEIV